MTTICRVSYTHGYQIRTTTYSCPKKDFGTVIGSALAYVAYIELLATLVIGGMDMDLYVHVCAYTQAHVRTLACVHGRTRTLTRAHDMRMTCTVHTSG